MEYYLIAVREQRQAESEHWRSESPTVGELWDSVMHRCDEY